MNVSDARAGLHEALEAFVERGADPAGLTIRYRIGDAFSGETELELRGDGNYELSSTATSGRAMRTYSGRVDETTVQELARELRAARIWEVEHTRSKPREDDPVAAIAVEANGRSGSVELWVSEIADSPQFRGAQESLLALIRQLSADEVLETGT